MIARRHRGRSRLSLLTVAAGILLALSVGASQASAEGHTEQCKKEGCAWWRLDSTTAPTFLVPGTEAQITVTAQDLGAAAMASSGEKHVITIADTLPAGLKPTSIEGRKFQPLGENKGKMLCPSTQEVEEGKPLRCTWGGGL